MGLVVRCDLQPGEQVEGLLQGNCQAPGGEAGNCNHRRGARGARGEGPEERGQRRQRGGARGARAVLCQGQSSPVT